MEKRSGRPSFPRLEEFRKQFRLKFGREMTQDELHFYSLADELLHNPPEEEPNKKKKASGSGE